MHIFLQIENINTPPKVGLLFIADDLNFDLVSFKTTKKTCLESLDITKIIHINNSYFLIISQNILLTISNANLFIIGAFFQKINFFCYKKFYKFQFPLKIINQYKI